MNLEAKIRQLIVEDVNASIALHEGSCELVDVLLYPETVMIVIKYDGACVGCPSSKSGTLRFIEEYVKEELLDMGLFKGDVHVITNEMFDKLMDETKEQFE